MDQYLLVSPECGIVILVYQIEGNGNVKHSKLYCNNPRGGSLRVG